MKGFCLNSPLKETYIYIHCISIACIFLYRNVWTNDATFMEDGVSGTRLLDFKMEPGSFQINLNNSHFHKQCMGLCSLSMLSPVLSLNYCDQSNGCEDIHHFSFNLHCPSYPELENLVYVFTFIYEYALNAFSATCTASQQ